MAKLLLYCTKAKPYLWKYWFNGDNGCGYNYETSFSHEEWKYEGTILNGKIVAECDCDKVEDLSKWEYEYFQLLIHLDLYAGTNGNYPFISNYLNGEKKGYALHLSNVKVFDEPKQLNHYIDKDYHLINKSPQNMCYCHDESGNKYVLISIHPKWICKILNGEKTIEIRKQIVNELKKIKKI